MSVTDPIRDLIYYDTAWKKNSPNKQETIEKYNNDKNRFLYYPWGVWVTAYARARLLSAILEVGAEDYLYSDTDSIKYLHPERHTEYFERENRRALDLLEAACKYHHLSSRYIRPKTREGKEKPLGVWDADGTFQKFKALRAKAYCYLDNDEVFHLTVAGLNKLVTVPYLLNEYKTPEGIFEAFADSLYIPAYATGKNTHSYCDREISGVLTDYRGISAPYSEKSFVHLEESEYSLSLKEEYKNYILIISQDQAL